MSEGASQAPVTFGEWLDRELAKKGWKPADIARSSGIYPSTISKYRNGVQVPHEQQARQLAEALGVPLSEVLEAAGKGRGLRSGQSMSRQAIDLVARIPDDLLPLALPYLESLADERRWNRYRTALAESRRVYEKGPGDGPEPLQSSETEATDVPAREQVARNS